MVIDSRTGAAILMTQPTRIHPAYRLLVDVKNFLWLSQFKWTPVRTKNGSRTDGRTNNLKDHVYFNTAIRTDDGRYRNLSMHRLIMANPHGKLVAFVEHNYFDLRESQLAVVNQKQVNEHIRKTTKPTASGFKGVTFEWRYGRPRRYIAQASHHNKLHRVGVYPPTPEGEIAAAHAYDLFVLANYSNPWTNYPVETYKASEFALNEATARAA